MSFAFPAFFVFLLLLPGLILRYTYTRGFFRNQSPVTFDPIADQLAYGVGLSALLHVLSTLVSWYFFSRKVDFGSSLALLTGAYGKDNELFEVAVHSFSDNIVAVTVYFLSLYAASAVIGYSVHFLVRSRGFDRKYPFLRFNNEWFYLLTGEVLQFPDPPVALTSIGRAEDVEVRLSAVVQQGDTSYVYQGFVYDFAFDRNRNLDHIIIRNPSRRKLVDDKPVKRKRKRKPPPPRFYEIGSDVFILKTSEMRTMNLVYFVLSDD